MVNNIQHRIDQMQRASAHQYAYPEAESDSEQDEEDINIDNNQVEYPDDASDMSSDLVCLQYIVGSDKVS